MALARAARRVFAALAASINLAAYAQALPAAPEHPSGWIDKKPATSHRFME